MSEEILERHNNRLIEAEGRIFALTYILNKLLTATAVPEVVKSEIEKYRAICCEPDENDDDYMVKFKDAAGTLFGLVSGDEPEPPKPTLRVIPGGKKA
jgi:hypothetical protein